MIVEKLRVQVSAYDSWDFNWAVPAGFVVKTFGYAPRDPEVSKHYEEIVELTLVPCLNHGNGCCECSYRNVEEEAPREEDLVDLCVDCNCPIPAGDLACEDCRPLEMVA